MAHAALLMGEERIHDGLCARVVAGDDVLQGANRGEALLLGAQLLARGA
jgi:hypothetical protein